LNWKWIVSLWVILGGLIYFLIHQTTTATWEDWEGRDAKLINSSWTGYQKNGNKAWSIKIKTAMPRENMNKVVGLHATEGRVYTVSGNSLVSGIYAKNIVAHPSKQAIFAYHIYGNITPFKKEREFISFTSSELAYDPELSRVVLKAPLKLVLKNNVLISENSSVLDLRTQSLQIRAPFRIKTPTFSITSETLEIDFLKEQYRFENRISVLLKDGRRIKSDRLVKDNKRDKVSFIGNIELLSPNLKWILEASKKQKLDTPKWALLVQESTKLTAEYSEMTSKGLLASGNVLIQQSKRVIKTDRLFFDTHSGIISLEGNVVWDEPEESTFYSEKVTLDLNSEIFEAHGNTRTTFYPKRKKKQHVKN